MDEQEQSKWLAFWVVDLIYVWIQINKIIKNYQY